MKTAISLSRLLSTSRNVRAQPPPSVIANGVVALSIHDIQSLPAAVLQHSIITVTPPTPSETPPQADDNSCSHRTVVRLWPLDAVDDGFVAIDDASLQTLNISPERLTVPSHKEHQRTPRGKRGKRKSGGSSGRSTLGTPGTPHTPVGRTPTRSTPRSGSDAPDTPDSSVVQVSINVLPPDCVLSAKTLCLSTDAQVTAIASDEFSNAVHLSLRGRALLPQMHIPMTLLGAHVNFCVISVTASTFHLRDAPCMVVENTVISIVPANGREARAYGEASATSSSPAPPSLLSTVGGLDVQIKELTSWVQTAIHPSDNDLTPETDFFTSHVVRGVLIHGPAGTGKTLLATAVAQASKAHVEVISATAIVDSLTDTATPAIQALDTAFARARRRAPSIILLDDVDALAPRRDAAAFSSSGGSALRVTAALLALLDGVDGQGAGEGVIVIGTVAKRDNVDGAVRRAGRLDIDIELAVPDAIARAEILRRVSKVARGNGRVAISEEEMDRIAASCHGFVGADLAAVWREAVGRAVERSGEKAAVIQDDLTAALRRVGPSALREVAVEVPSTRWDDIGGMEEVKRRLREAVEWPLSKHGAEMFERLNIPVPRGVLLFGPPGCSKTMLARAVATESGANFISVKGAELLSKWVGESEKAVRRMFARAREAAPCVVFFDEVDAIAGARGDGAGAQSRVVAQLLHEMDGIEGRHDGVIVMAATNRPDCLDGAFIRPGRMDTRIYVGLPGVTERLAILRVHTRKVPLAVRVSLEDLAADYMTGGFSGAEVAALVREAGLCAMERDIEAATEVQVEDFQVARERVSPRTPPKLLAYFKRFVRQQSDFVMQ